MNPETALNSAPPQQLPPPPRRRGRPMKCKFCSGIGHNIYSCNDPMALTIVRNIQIMFQNVYSIDYALLKLTHMPLNYVLLFAGSIRKYNPRTAIPDCANYVVNVNYGKYMHQMEGKPPAVREEIRERMMERFRTQYILAMGMSRETERRRVIPTPAYRPIPPTPPSNLLSGIQVSRIETEKPPSGKHNCPICYENKTSLSMVMTNCGHALCGNCTVSMLKKKMVNCPMCRTKMSEFKTHGVKCQQMLNKVVRA